ncbi:unnamed protein product [Wickerhamomyces anomalus]
MSYTKFDPKEDITTKIIRCPFSKCNTRIIKPKVANLHEFKIGLNFLKIDENEIQESAKHDRIFLRIEDAWDFDNIGVSKDIKTHALADSIEDDDVERLIVCADCERGPLGFAKFDKDENSSKDVKNLKYYLHLNSCLYQ